MRDAENSKVLFVFCAALRAQIARHDGLLQPAVARLRTRLLRDPKLGRNVVMPAISATAASAMRRKAIS